MYMEKMPSLISTWLMTKREDCAQSKWTRGIVMLWHFLQGQALFLSKRKRKKKQHQQESLEETSSARIWISRNLSQISIHFNQRMMLFWLPLYPLTVSQILDNWEQSVSFYAVIYTNQNRTLQAAWRHSYLGVKRIMMFLCLKIQNTMPSKTFCHIFRS